MKRAGSLALFSLLVISMFASFAIAQGTAWTGPAPTTTATNSNSGSVVEALDTVYQAIRPVIEVIIGETQDSQLFLAKILLLIIVFVIIWQVIENVSFVGGNEGVRWVLSIAVSILSVRYLLNPALVKAIVLPYSALGVTISAGLPFIVFFWIVKGFGKRATRLAWILFIVVFVGLWVTRGPEIGGYSWIYLVTAGLGFISLVMDGTIKKYMNEMS